MAVTTRSIVERINVIRDVSDRQLSVLVDLFLDPLLLQTAKERLGDGIVPAIPFAAHARLEAIRTTESSPRITAVLRALIRVNQRPARSTPAHRHQDRIE